MANKLRTNDTADLPPSKPLIGLLDSFHLRNARSTSDIGRKSIVRRPPELRNFFWSMNPTMLTISELGEQ